MKHAYILFIILFFISCTNEEQILTDTATGYFSISNLSLSCDEEILPLTRSVDAALQLQICQGEEVIKEYAPGDDLSKRIVLPVGTYTLKAFTPDQSEAANDEIGIPVYEVISPFEVREGDIASISLVVPQINVGVSVNVSDEFKANFHNLSVTITSVSGRSITISDVETSSLYYYFAIPSDGKLKYTVTAYNADNEEMTLDKEIVSINLAKNYSIYLDLPN